MPIIKLMQEVDGTWTEVTSTDQNYYRSVGTGNYLPIDFDVENLDPGKYKLVIESYTVNTSAGTKTLTWKTDYEGYQLTQGVHVWSEGSKTTAQVQDGSFTVPADALAVDLTGADASQVQPNNNPNTVYLLAEAQDVPASLQGKNIVVSSADGTLSCASLNVYDGYSFLMPWSVTAWQAAFHLSKAATTWQTLMLPFDAKTTNDKLHLAEFSADASDALYFTEVADGTLEASKAYLVSASADQAGKEIVFSGENVPVETRATVDGVRGDSHRYAGTLQKAELTNVYTLNAEGTTFVMQAATNLNPFHACVIGYGQLAKDATVRELPVYLNGTPVTAVHFVRQPSTDAYTVYGLDGAYRGTYRNLETAPLQKGLYVVNGKTMVK